MSTGSCSPRCERPARSSSFKRSRSLTSVVRRSGPGRSRHQVPRALPGKPRPTCSMAIPIARAASTSTSTWHATGRRRSRWLCLATRTSQHSEQGPDSNPTRTPARPAMYCPSPFSLAYRRVTLSLRFPRVAARSTRQTTTWAVILPHGPWSAAATRLWWARQRGGHRRPLLCGRSWTSRKVSHRLQSASRAMESFAC